MIHLFIQFQSPANVQNPSYQILKPFFGFSNLGFAALFFILVLGSNVAANLSKIFIEWTSKVTPPFDSF